MSWPYNTIRHEMNGSCVQYLGHTILSANDRDIVRFPFILWWIVLYAQDIVHSSHSSRPTLQSMAVTLLLMF